MQERLRHYWRVLVYVMNLPALFQSFSLLCLKSGEKLKKHKPDARFLQWIFPGQKSVDQPHTTTTI